MGGIAGVPVANPKTGTVYVPVLSGHVVAVISAARCNARIAKDCRVVARARVGTSPVAGAVDEKTDTVYVVNSPQGAAGTVSVVNGARCNATVTRGCGRPLATIKVGKIPVAAAFNPATRTLYVANVGSGSVSVIDAAGCNAVTTRGCGHAVKTVKDRFGPAAVDVDVATDTVYVANGGLSGNGDTVSVIDGAACNGHTGRGCGRATRTVKVGSGAFSVSVDQATETVYVANNNDNTVSAIDGARCNARVGSGCRRTPPTVTPGAQPQFVAVDQALHTAFAINQGDGTLSAINTRTCGATVTSGCRTRPPNEQATFNPAHGFNPNAFALVHKTGTAYLVNVGGARIVSVVSINRCNAIHTAGCRHEAPSVPEHEFTTTVDPATDTIYAGNLNRPQIDVISGATCNAARLSGCAPVAEIPIADPEANVGDIDQATHTLYASDPFSDTVSIIDTATCNAAHTAGCPKAPPTVAVGPGPGPPALNPGTKTLYVPFGNAANRVAVVNAATCNAENTSGCGQAPGIVKVGKGTFVLAVSHATDTIYAPSTGAPAFDGDTVAVINGAACNGTDHSGCGHLAATVMVGLAPLGVAVNDRTRTVYVANNTLGQTPGTVSVIDGATCNGSRTSGCAGRMPTAPVGRSPNNIAVDTRTDTIYVTDENSATVSVLNGAKCRAGVTSGCRSAVTQQAVGPIPIAISINQRTRTVYVTQVFQLGSMSIFKARRY